MARFGMVIDTVRCVGCMDCVVACKTENEVPEGLNRDWIVDRGRRARSPTPRLEIRSERCNHCDNPPCVDCCPTGASHVEPFGRLVLVDRRALHRLQGLPGLLPLRRALRPPGGLRRQVHLLRPPREGGAGPRLRGGLPDALHALRRPRRSGQRGARACSRRAAHHVAAARGRHPAAHLLPDVRTPAMTELTTTRANHLVDPLLHVWGWEIPVYLFLGGLVAGMMIISGYFLFSGRRRTHGLRLLPAARARPRPAQPRHAGAVPRPRAQALRLAALHHLQLDLADVVGRLDPACSSTRRCSPTCCCACRSRCAGASRRSRTCRTALGGRARRARGSSARSTWCSGGLLGIYTGVLLSALGARPLWNSALLGPLFLVSGLSSAAAFVHMVARDRGRARAAGQGRQRASWPPSWCFIAPLPDRPAVGRPRRTCEAAGAAARRPVHRGLLGRRRRPRHRAAARRPAAGGQPPRPPHPGRAAAGASPAASRCASSSSTPARLSHWDAGLIRRRDTPMSTRARSPACRRDGGPGAHARAAGART